MEKYGQKLPKNVEQSLDKYIERIKSIKWFQPSSTLDKKDVDTKVKACIDAFGVKATVEYRQLKTSNDWDAAWDAARDAAWDAARDAAWGAALDAARDAARGAAWDAAWDAARDAARGAAWDAARGADETLVKDLKEYKGKFAFLSLVDIYELGLYPVGVVNGKFLVFVPPCKMEFPEVI